MDQIENLERLGLGAIDLAAAAREADDRITRLCLRLEDAERRGLLSQVADRAGVAGGSTSDAEPSGQSRPSIKHDAGTW